MSMKYSNDTIGNRTRDLLTCSAVPQPTAPPRSPVVYQYSTTIRILQIWPWLCNLQMLFYMQWFGMCIIFVPRYTCKVPHVYCLAQSVQNFEEDFHAGSLLFDIPQKYQQSKSAQHCTLHMLHPDKISAGHVGQDRCLCAYRVHNVNGC